MSDPTEREVRDAIETIQSSYSYDPPSRWLEAHTLLRSLRIQLLAQFHPYRWIGQAGAWIGVCALVGLLLLLFVRPSFLSTLMVSFPFPLGLILYVTAVSVPAWIISASRSLAHALATRRHPLMKFKDAVEASAARFEDRYAAAIAGANA